MSRARGEAATRAAVQKARDGAGHLRKYSARGPWSDRAGMLDRKAKDLNKTADELRREREKLREREAEREGEAWEAESRQTEVGSPPAPARPAPSHFLGGADGRGREDAHAGVRRGEGRAGAAQGSTEEG